ncbi:MAG: ABC transporter permease [Actinobacteria bacterium]|nr:ABC transporter permease [Actinomycetota bacterium]
MISAEERARTGAEETTAFNLRALLGRYAFLLVLMGFVVFFSVRTDAFLSLGNLVNVLEGNAVLLIVALAMTLVVASGGIDLSVGIAVDFGAAFAVVAMKDYSVTWQIAVVIAVMGGAIVGLLNAFLIVRLRVSPFLATLGTLFIGGSVQRIYTNGGGQVSFRKMPEGYRNLAVGSIFGIPTEIVIAAAVLVVYFVMLERSTHGKRIHAIGLQSEASVVAGIRVKRYRWFVYVAAAATCAIGGVILTAGLRQYTPLAGFSYLLDAIGAVFIGAAMHPRRRPNIPGTLIGVLFLGVATNGLNLMGVDFNLKAALTGIILVGALAFSALQRRVTADG